jgi:hypothetical protein
MSCRVEDHVGEHRLKCSTVWGDDDDGWPTDVEVSIPKIAKEFDGMLFLLMSPANCEHFFFLWNT